MQLNQVTAQLLAAPEIDYWMVYFVLRAEDLLRCLMDDYVQATSLTFHQI